MLFPFSVDRNSNFRFFLLARSGQCRAASSRAAARRRQRQRRRRPRAHGCSPGSRSCSRGRWPRRDWELEADSTRRRRNSKERRHHRRRRLDPDNAAALGSPSPSPAGPTAPPWGCSPGGGPARRGPPSPLSKRRCARRGKDFSFLLPLLALRHLSLCRSRSRGGGGGSGEERTRTLSPRRAAAFPPHSLRARAGGRAGAKAAGTARRRVHSLLPLCRRSPSSSTTV